MTRVIELGQGVLMQPVTECPHTPACPHDDAGCIEPVLAGWVFIHPRPGAPDYGFGPDVCSGMVYARARGGTGRPRNVWTIVEREPLTLSPSVQCTSEGCTCHGWVREGKWVPA